MLLKRAIACRFFKIKKLYEILNFQRALLLIAWFIMSFFIKKKIIIIICRVGPIYRVAWVTSAQQLIVLWGYTVSHDGWKFKFQSLAQWQLCCSQCHTMLRWTWGMSRPLSSCQGFFPRGTGGPPDSENFAHPPTDRRPRFLTRACLPQLSFVPKNVKNFTLFSIFYYLFAQNCIRKLF